MARFGTEVNAPWRPTSGASNSRAAGAAWARPESARWTSVQPVNRFSRFQVLWPWRTRMSFPGISAGQLAHRPPADRQRGEVARARRAHVGERALPVRQVLAGRFHPGADARLGAAAALACQHPLGEAALHPQRRIAQPGAGDRLPRALDGELLDARAQPVKADACADFEVHASGLGDSDALRSRDFHDVERGGERLEAGDARREPRREPRLAVVRAALVKARQLRPGEQLGNFRFQLVHAVAELPYRGIDLQPAAT